MADNILEKLDTPLALVIAAWFAGGAATLIGHLIVNLLSAPDGMAYVVAYVFAGWMFGSLLYFLRHLVRSAIAEETAMASKQKRRSSAKEE